MAETPWHIEHISHDSVYNELARAIEKHPNWPGDNLLRQAVIVSEEAGEALRAALNIVEAAERGALHGPRSPLYVALDAELVQTAAMALRFLYHLRKRRTDYESSRTT